MEQEKKKRGGAGRGQGRKPVASEKQVNEIFLTALKQIHKTDNDETAKVKFACNLLETERGRVFVAEHLFGKPKETIDQTLTFDSLKLKDFIKFEG